MGISLMGLLSCPRRARAVTGCGQRKGDLAGCWHQWEEKEQIRMAEMSKGVWSLSDFSAGGASQSRGG